MTRGNGGPWDYILPPGATLTAQQTSMAAWIISQVAGGKRLITYSAPTGTGKSVLNLAAASRIGPCYYITPQNVLVRQLGTDRLTGPSVATVMGSGNYSCPSFGSCDVGRSAGCPNASKSRRDAGAWDGEYVSPVAAPGSCPYEAATRRVRASKCAVTNLHYYFFGPLRRDERPVLVCDEAQDLEEVMAGLHRITVGGHGDAAAQRAGLQDIGKSEEAVAAWWPFYVAEMEAELERVKTQFSEAADSYIRHRDSAHLALLRDLKKRMFALERKIANAATMEEETEKQALPWCVDFPPTRDGGFKIVASPVTVQRFCRRYLLGEGNNGGNGRVALVSSATPPSRLDLDATEDEYARCDVETGFPLENRPVFWWPVASTAKRNRDTGLVRVAAAIDLLARTRYAGKRGLVHCHAKSVMRDLAALLKTPHLSQREGEREASLEEWTRGTVPIFLSVAMEQGIDLDGDKCRWQVLPVVPFPDLGDKRVQLRKSLPDGGEWFARRTAYAITQASGRNVRSATDWGHTWILSKEFRIIWNLKTRNLFPAWWRAAVQELPESWRPAQ